MQGNFMKTNPRTKGYPRRSYSFAIAMAALAAMGLSSCSQEDAALQTQLVEARALLDAKVKALDKAEADLAKFENKSGPGISSEEIAKLKARNHELEDQLAAARAQNSAGSAPPKFDMEAMAAKLEDDLTVKAKQLRELLQKQTSTGKVDEISLKAITYPAEIVTPFSSSITFSMIMEDGKNIRLMFPVTADLSGVWKLPGPDAVQKAFEQAQRQPQQLATNPPAGSGPAPQSQSAPAGSSGGGASMRQVDGNTFVFNWGDGPPPAVAPAPAQPRQAPTPNTPPAPVASAPQSTAPPAPQQPAAAVPAPVMPVQRDVVIKFD